MSLRLGIAALVFTSWSHAAGTLPTNLADQVILNFDFTQSTPAPPYGFVQFYANVINASVPGLHATLYDGLNGQGASHAIDVTSNYVNNGELGFGWGLPMAADGVFSVGVYDTTGKTSMIDANAWARIFPSLQQTPTIHIPISYLYPGTQGAIVPLPGGSSGNPSAVTIPTREIFDIVPPGITERYYSFHLSSPGLVTHISMDFGGDPLDSHSNSFYQVLLYDGFGRSIPVLHRKIEYFEAVYGSPGSYTDQFVDGGTWLDTDNGFKAEITAWGNSVDGYGGTCFNGFFNNNHGGKSQCVLGGGDYVLGVKGYTYVDPELSIVFSADVSAPVPEPARGPMMAAGIAVLAVLGASRRSHKPRPERE